MGYSKSLIVFAITTLIVHPTTTLSNDESNEYAAHAQSIQCLAKNIYYEARGEPRLGQIAVGMVTMNRVASGNFPNSICDVVKQKENNSCQFSWVCSKALPRVKHDVFKESQRVAMMVYNGHVKDPTGGATHFHAVGVKPKWASNGHKTAQIGNHSFYKRVSHNVHRKAS